MRSRILPIILALLLVLSNGSFALALEPGTESSDFYDMPNDWSTVALNNAVDNGLLKGYKVDDKTFIYGKNPVTRAEMAAVINRAFGATVKADISEAGDVAANRWYADEMAKAVNMRAFSMDTQIRPNDNITRQEAFVVLSRVFKITSADENLLALNNFSDKGQISGWAKKGLCGMAEAGYIKGSDGMLLPLATISRAEFAVVMDNLVKQYITQPGTITQVAASGNVLVRSDGVTLKNLTVKGDLIIGDGVGEGEAILDGVIVEGNVIVRGGGPNSIIIRGNSDIGKIILTKVNGEIRIVVEGDADVEIIYVDDGSDDVILQGTVGLMEIAGDNINARAEPSMEGRVIITGNSSFVIFGDVTVGDTLIPAGGGGGGGGGTGGGDTPLVITHVSTELEISEFWVAYGTTSLGAIEALVAGATVNGSDESQEETSLSWEAPENYDETSPGAYTFTGTLTLPSGWTGPMNPVTATVYVMLENESNFVFDKYTGTITKYIGTSTTIVIPESILGVAVTILGVRAFNNDCGVSITSVSIPSGVVKIGANAFYNQKSLININIPGTVTSLGMSAFGGCSRLTTLTIPESVKSIGAGAFTQCSGLTSIVIPEGVTSIGQNTFQWCSSLASINIPSGVTSIGEYAFGYCNLTEINIPSSVTSIGDYAFRGCKELITVAGFTGVTSIGKEAFYACFKLNSINISEGVTSIGERTFRDCYALSSIVLPESVTSIGEYAFGDTALTSVVIPAGVTTIGKAAFEKCTALTSISILGTGAKTFGDGCFNPSGVTYVTVSSAAVTFGNNLFTSDNAFREAYNNQIGIYNKSGTGWTKE